MSWMTTAGCPFFEKRFTLPWRFFFYVIPWLGAAAALWISLGPDHYPSETDKPPFQQAIELPFWTPLLVMGGLGYLVFGEHGGLPEVGLLALGFLTHAGFALSRRSVTALISLFSLQAILAAIGVAGYIQFVAGSRCP